MLDLYEIFPPEFTPDETHSAPQTPRPPLPVGMHTREPPCAFYDPWAFDVEEVVVKMLASLIIDYKHGKVWLKSLSNVLLQLFRERSLNI